MRTFEQISSASGLVRFVGSTMGTLYFRPGAAEEDRMLVRHFDGALAPELAATYADLVHGVAHWVAATPEVDRWVEVVLPLEVGTDFVARPHPTYYSSTAGYEGVDGPPEPAELEAMRDAVRAAIAAEASRGSDPRAHEVIARVLAASLLEPTGRTYFDEVADRFVVVEPKIGVRDVEEWRALRD